MISEAIKDYFPSRWGDDGVIMEVDYCLAPGTKVLTHDFRYVPIETVETGDELVGFEEDIRTYNQTEFRKATVTATKIIKKPCLRLHFDDGTSVVCSTNHQWVAGTRPRYNNLSWQAADALIVGDYIPQVTEVWEDLSGTPEGAWMGGFLDGEGWISHASTFGVGQNKDEAHNCVWDKFLPILERDFPAGVALCPNKANKVVRAAPYGLRTAWQAVGMYRPVRLLKTLQETYEGTILRSKRNRKKVITRIEDVGTQEVVAIQTDTHTFIAEGMPSHNCQLEVVVAAALSRDPQLRADLLEGKSMHCMSAHFLTDEPYEEILWAYEAGDPWAKKVRQTGKGLSFELQYGAGPPSMARKHKLELWQTEQFVENYYTRYSGLAAWQECVRQEIEATATYAGDMLGPTAVRRGTYRAPTGQRFTLVEEPTGRKEPAFYFKPTKAKNYPIQGTACTAVVLPTLGAMRRALVADPEMRERCLMIMMVHDSCIFDCHRSVVDRAKQMIHTVFEGAPQRIEQQLGMKFDLPLQIEIELGPTWGTMK